MSKEKDQAESTDKVVEKKDDHVAIFNKGLRTYQTSAGPLHPKQSITVPADEAKKHMDYFDIVDLNKVAPKAGAEIKDLRAENARLKAELAAKESSPKDSAKGGNKGDK